MNQPGGNPLDQMADITGLDSISMWPLAPGWWGVMCVPFVVMAAIAIINYRRKAWERTWRADAQRSLDALEGRLDGRAAQEVAAELSAILRRIAMKRFSRAACAGLEGKDWLSWLKKNDPQGFDWESDGRLLTEAPYAPPGIALPPEKIRRLIGAVRPWVG
jgi:hypothetical protein